MVDVVAKEDCLKVVLLAACEVVPEMLYLVMRKMQILELDENDFVEMVKASELMVVLSWLQLLLLPLVYLP